MPEGIKSPEPLKSTVVLDETGEHWEAQLNAMLEKCTNIIALRGAGSFNGISIKDAERILKTELIPRVQKYLDAKGKVAIIYDGDDDEPNYPDIGHIMGGLRDHFRDRVDFFAVQTTSWYRYNEELPKMRPLHSANGNEYNTTLFPDKKFQGEHDHFSQNQRLAQSPKYEQWYIGACGQIASKQLADYSTKAGDATLPHKVLIFRSPISTEQEQKIRGNITEIEKTLKEFETSVARGDVVDESLVQKTVEKKNRLSESLKRRAVNPFGLLCDEKGEFIRKPEYGNLNIEII
jgi:hypothetical protein